MRGGSGGGTGAGGGGHESIEAAGRINYAASLVRISEIVGRAGIGLAVGAGTILLAVGERGDGNLRDSRSITTNSMKTLLFLFALIGLAIGQQPTATPSDYALPYERPCTKDGHPNKQVFQQSPDDPNVVLVTRYYWVDAQVPFWQKRETEKWSREEALNFIARERLEERIRIQNRIAAQNELRRQQIAAEEQRRRDLINNANIKESVREAVERALEDDRMMHGR
jgi:hypothetical protein